MAKFTIPPVTNSSRKKATAPLPAKSPEKTAKSKKLPGKAPGAMMGKVASASKRGTR